MAQKVQILLVDDLDGGKADETVTFALDGVSYEIDLSATHAEQLRTALTTYVESGRRTGGRAAARRTGVRQPGKGAAPAGDTAKIRAWAKENGHDVSERGRVPGNIREAYEKAHA